MNVEIGAEAALFPEKEYINGIFVAVQAPEYTIRAVSNFCRISRRIFEKNRNDPPGAWG
jgi:hypothetical protein